MIPRKNLWAVVRDTVNYDSSIILGKGKIQIQPFHKQSSRKSSIRKWVIDHLRTYCEHSTVHGINFLAMKELNRVGKLFWFVINLVAIICCIVLLRLAADINYKNPTVTVIESTYFPIWNIPFPAVTICNFNKISKRAAYKLAENFTRPANVSVDDLVMMFQYVMHFDDRVDLPNEEYMRLHQILITNNYDVQSLLSKLYPRCEDMLLRCKFKTLQLRCDSLFERINGSYGACCSFNFLGFFRRNVDKKQSKMIDHPRRTVGCGHPTGLSVLVNPMKDDYLGRYFSAAGLRILIHDSYNFPDENAEMKLISVNTENFITTFPETTYATSSVRRLTPKERYCYFSDEGNLRAMRRYSYVNCMAECRSLMSLNKCGCVPPNLPNNGSFPTCGANKIQCMSSITNVLRQSLLGINFTDYQQTRERPCGCLPDCESNEYFGEIVSLAIDRKNSFNDKKFFQDVSVQDATLLHVFYKSMLSKRFRTDVPQDWLMWFGNVGGLFGLFLGLSLISVFEFFYFLMIRPLCLHFQKIFDFSKKNKIKMSTK